MFPGFWARVLLREHANPWAGKERRYFMLGGKGGVGKTSAAASLAVKLAQEGHSVLVVSTDPAHSLSDSLDQAWGPTPAVTSAISQDECPVLYAPRHQDYG